jgi:hypothetical protein
MKSESIEALRALAKKLGLTGYSKLRKADLLKLITSHDRKAQAKPATRANKVVALKPAEAKTSRRVPKKSTAADTKPTPRAAQTPWSRNSVNAEQQVESAKYAFAPPGTNMQEPTYSTDLREDIERLPDIRDALLCLLPQKPGVLHGYWVLPPSLLNAEQSIRLRLAQHAGDYLKILGEHPLPAERGHWYFHVEEAIELGAVYLQLGRYQDNGEFVSIIQRGIARIPNLYASTLTDRRWWVSDAQFREMYRRAGGVEHGVQLGWAGSASSPGGPLHGPGGGVSSPGAPLRWAGGGVSSQR